MHSNLLKIDLIEIFKGRANNNLGIFLVHGATMTPFRETDQFVDNLKSICSEIFSITIPGHGRAKLTTPMILDFDYAMQLFTHSIKEKVETSDDRKFGFIGISLGAMMGMRIQKLFDFAIYIGCGNSFTKASLRNIAFFFSETTYQRFGMVDAMIRHHGEYWNILLQSIKNWYSEDSTLLTKPIHILTRPSIFILAENDQPFNEESIKFDTEVEIQKVSGDHFSYFSPKVLPEILNHINNAISSFLSEKTTHLNSI